MPKKKKKEDAIQNLANNKHLQYEQEHNYIHNYNNFIILFLKKIEILDGSTDVSPTR